MFGFLELRNWEFPFGHLHSSVTIIETVIVAGWCQSSSSLCLFFCQYRQHPKQYWYTGLKPDSAQPLGNRLTDVFEMFGFAFDETAQCNHRIAICTSRECATDPVR